MFDRYVPAFGEKNVHIIYNGVDLDAFQNPCPDRIRREFGVEPGEFAVGTFARLVEGKGIPEFIAAASRVTRRRGQYRFFIVGDDASEDRAFERAMRRLAEDAGLGDRLVFTGWRNDRIDVMAAMDLVLQISTTFPEGMSLAPLEAMALGKPVIVTDIPGYEFSVDDGKTGFVVSPGDVETLAERVLLLAENRELAQRLGRESRGKAVREFDVRLTARRVQALYDEVLQPSEGQEGRRGQQCALDSPPSHGRSLGGSVAMRDG
jgi:glycosyltransferase involved in cell wall biosynthesis